MSRICGHSRIQDRIIIPTSSSTERLAVNSIVVISIVPKAHVMALLRLVDEVHLAGCGPAIGGAPARGRFEVERDRLQRGCTVASGRGVPRPQAPKHLSIAANVLLRRIPART
jgi:hypothetical protein